MGSTDNWLSKEQIAALYKVSVRTIERRIQDLGPEQVRRNARPVLVCPEAVQAIFGESALHELSETNELLRTHAAIVEEDAERMRRELDANALRTELAVVRAELALSNERLERVSAERDAAFAAHEALLSALRSTT